MTNKDVVADLKGDLASDDVTSETLSCPSRYGDSHIDTAIEAAAKATHCIRSGSPPATEWEDLTKEEKALRIEHAKTAIEAYEAALWQDIKTLRESLKSSNTLTVLMAYQGPNGILVSRLAKKLYDEYDEDFFSKEIGDSTHWRIQPSPPKD